MFLNLNIFCSKSFVIVAREYDKILIEVKDKFARTKPSINRFLGRILLDLNTLVDKSRLTKGYRLNIHLFFAA